MHGQPPTLMTLKVTHDSASTPSIDGNATIAPVAIGLLLLLTLMLSLIAHRHYRQQANQRRIATLEKLWALSPKERLL